MWFFSNWGEEDYCLLIFYKKTNEKLIEIKIVELKKITPNLHLITITMPMR